MEEHRKSRVVVETPVGKREEVVSTQVDRGRNREGVSAGTVAALVIGAVALVTIIFLFLMNRQTQDETTTTNLQVATTAPTPLTQQQPVIVQQPPPTTTQPVIIQQPATTNPMPVIVPPTASTAPAAASSTSGVSDDMVIQNNVDKRIQDDQNLASLGLTATVLDGKVTLIGAVDSADLKSRAEQVVRAVKGVKSVDNQIIVTGSGTGGGPSQN